jgi:hypothetical protein
MTQISTRPGMDQAGACRPSQERPSQQTPLNRAGPSAPSAGRSAPVRKPLFRS